ncbi:AAA family ATPase [Exiguobacterium sp. s78]|uniref:AAA family ATPase n=1 Tax=Exiguobacterium sp. s78 TaxID=2751197 RepID=UPI001BE7559C|nr:AAA family ATPase [Exiguobacterium sp. s78]
MKIAVENFRSFERTGFLATSDLNIFIGKNSSGKSSLLRLFPLMKQTLANETSQPFLWYSPDYVDFGEYEDVIGSDKSKPITFKYEFRLSAHSFYNSQHLFSNLNNFTYSRKLQIDEYLNEVLSLTDWNVNFQISTKKEYVSQIKFKVENVDILINLDKGTLLSFFINNSLIYDNERDGNDEIIISPLKRNLVSVIDAVRVRNHSLFHMNSEFDRNTVESRILFSHVFIYPEILKLLSSLFSNLGVKYPEVNDDLVKMIFIGDFLVLKREHLIKRFEQFLDETFFINLYSDRKYTESHYKKLDEIVDLFISSYINEFLVAVDTQLQNYFSKVKYIAPLRATVQRYYRMQGIALSEMDASGANLPMILANMSPKSFESFQKWTMMHFGFSIIRKRSHGHISIFIKFENQEARNIIDLGFGYSQLLPIIVELWNTSKVDDFKKISDRSPLTIVIEQPELHLHPAMQSDFIDVCVNIVQFNKSNKNKRKVNFIIETHSETLINRVSESIKKEKLEHESVTVNVVNIDSDYKSSVKSIGFDEDGDLLEWPIGFFSAEPIEYDYKY